MTEILDGPAALASEGYPELLPLVQSVKDYPEALATGDYGIRDSALQAEKFIFDQSLGLEPMAGRQINALLKTLQNYESAPVTRSQAKASASKPPPPPLPPFVPTPLDALYLDGMNAEQVWEQLELKTKNVLKVLEAIVTPEPPAKDEEDESGEGSEQEGEGLDDLDDDMDLDMDAIDEYGGSDDEDEDEDEDDDAFALREDLSFDEDGEEEDETSFDAEESVAPLRPAHDDELIPILDLDRPGGRSASSSRRPAHPTLDDAFFSIDDFNRETEAMESKSRSGGGLTEDDDEEGEDEDVDLFAPIAGDGEEEEAEAFEEDDEDSGGGPSQPYYKDFFAPPPRPTPSKSKKRSRPDPAPADLSSLPSPSKKSKPDSSSPSTKKRGVSFSESVRVKTIEARKNTPGERLALFKRLGMSGDAIADVDGDDDEEEDSEEDEDEDGEGVDWDMEKFDDVDGLEEDEFMDEDEDDDEEDPDATESDPDLDGRGLDDEEEIGVETIQRLKNDLFDEDEDGDSQDAAVALSKHAKRQAALAEEIAAFEAENVGEKDWTLMGEATARTRPKNSLLEEDLDFERMGGARAAPAVTEEVTKSLEEKIKARIIEARYDDVVRRRSVEDDKPFLPSRYIELDGSKSSRSLAQIYEDEYSSLRDGGAGVIDDRDGKLAKEHEELEKMWGTICYKLDALSNAHFTPKAPSASITTVSNVATTSLESALPTTSSTSTLLAPEELLAPAKSASSLRDRSELTPAEKRAARMRDRKKRAKASSTIKAFTASRAGGVKGGKNGAKSQKEAKDEALRTLVKSGKGVTVVGKESANLKRDQAKGRGRGGKGVQAMTASAKGRARQESNRASGASFKL